MGHVVAAMEITVKDEQIIKRQPVGKMTSVLWHCWFGNMEISSIKYPLHSTLNILHRSRRST